MKLSTKIKKEIKKVLQEHARLNIVAEKKINKKLTHDIIQLTLTEVSKVCLKVPELVEPLRKVIK